MTPEVEIHEEASQELEDAALFYEQRVPGLGDQFLDHVTRAAEQIVFSPESCPVLGETIRRKALSRFPYSLMYLFENDRVFIVAVAHPKREPGYWHHRFPRR